MPVNCTDHLYTEVRGEREDSTYNTVLVFYTVVGINAATLKSI